MSYEEEDQSKGCTRARPPPALFFPKTAGARPVSSSCVGGVSVVSVVWVGVSVVTAWCVSMFV